MSEKETSIGFGLAVRYKFLRIPFIDSAPSDALKRKATMTAMVATLSFAYLQQVT
ncbi:hypothetical protein [Paraglaciecola sp. L3A3]|uniref:hypothetical protein n=1 Tax=Paraglaciecola sp. L3A3 TaxID=2686358 RepID=UPI00131D067C|nr:hypothetical protein [Paraglaciecola sp. L3A3]